MSLFDTVQSLLSQYASGAVPHGDAGTHFQQVSQSVDADTLAHGISTALRSDQTPPFAQIVSQLFSAGSGDQKVAMLNTLLSSVSPDQRAALAALVPGLAAGSSVTPAQAAAVTPSALQSVVQRVEQHDGGIVEKMSAVYAAHPTLVQTMGATAMMIAMRAIASRRASSA